MTLRIMACLLSRLKIPLLQNHSLQAKPLTVKALLDGHRNPTIRTAAAGIGGHGGLPYTKYSRTLRI